MDEQENLDWGQVKPESTQEVEAGVGFLVASYRDIAQLCRDEFKKAKAQLNQGLWTKQDRLL